MISSYFSLRTVDEYSLDNYNLLFHNNFLLDDNLLDNFSDNFFFNDDFLDDFNRFLNDLQDFNKDLHRDLYRKDNFFLDYFLYYFLYLNRHFQHDFSHRAVQRQLTGEPAMPWTFNLWTSFDFLLLGDWFLIYLYKFFPLRVQNIFMSRSRKFFFFFVSVVVPAAISALFLVRL